MKDFQMKMQQHRSHKFKAEIKIIGINPYVVVPDDILEKVFKQAEKNKGSIPIKGTVNGKDYKQTLVKYSGAWRLYINTTMLKDSPKRIGEIVAVSVAFDPEKRIVTPHPKFVKALKENKAAETIFNNLRPSLQHEILRYLSYLKTEESVDRNVLRAIDFLLGKGRFVGRANP
ncbi:MAG: YdeI/OmpD-associated family protein [Ferruginibacter sp.]